MIPARRRATRPIARRTGMARRMTIAVVAAALVAVGIMALPATGQAPGRAER